MYDYTVSLSEAENQSMSFVAYNVNDWIQNAVHERARLAFDQTFEAAMHEFLSRGEPMPGSKEEIVSLAFAKGYLKTLKEVTDEMMNSNTTPYVDMTT